VHPPSDDTTVVVLPLFVVVMLLDATPAPVVTLEPLPELTDTPLPLPPTDVCPETWPLPAWIEVDMPLGAFSPGLRCTTLHPLVFEVLLALSAAPAKPAMPIAVSAAMPIVASLI